MSRQRVDLVTQTDLQQYINLPRPISNVKSMKVRFISASSLTSSGTLLYLDCPEVARTNIPLSSILGDEHPMVWREVYPVPSARSDQLPPLCFDIASGNPAAMDISSFPIRLGSNGTITPGFSILWEFTWEIGGPDNLLKPY